MGFRVGDNAPMAFVELVDRPGAGRDRSRRRSIEQPDARAQAGDAGPCRCATGRCPLAAHRPPDQALRRRDRRRRPVARDHAGRVPRRDRPERRRQDDDDPHLPRPRRPGRRRDRGLRPAAARRRCARRRSGSASSRSSTASTPTSPAPRTCASTAPTSACRARRSTSACRSCSSSPRCRRRPARKPGELSGGMKRRLSLGRALDQRPRPAAARRAHHRPRSAGAPPDVGAAAEPAAAGQGDPADDALHGRGRAPVRPPDRARPRPQDRRGHAARADRRAPGERRGRGLRRRRGRGRGERTRRSPSASRPAARPSSSTCATPSRCSRRWPTTTASATCTARPTSRTCSSS